ncbi:MAG: helix-turn-helix domain-containing protein [Ruminococcus sp.]|nr:helix-turn-helix domain-containing protein [Ruminococcus sp.]
MQDTSFLTIPYNILNLKGLTLSAKILLAEIISLSKLEGYCYASNAYLAKRLGISKRAVCNSLNELRKRQLISSSMKSRNERYIYPVFSKLKECNICAPSSAKSAPVERKNCTQGSAKSAHNNNIYNNSNNTNYKERANSKRDYYMPREPSYDIEELMKIK